MLKCNKSAYVSEVGDFLDATLIVNTKKTYIKHIELALSYLICQFMNQTRQGIKMEHAPGGNPAMHPGMQPSMQPAGMSGQVGSQHFLICI